jgi:hypothetical protein
MAILGRASAELEGQDWTLAIVLSAMAVECDLAYLFMKWNRIEVMSKRMPTDADDEAWERQWRDEARTAASRLDKVSEMLTQEQFDLFLSKNSHLLQAMSQKHPALKDAASPKDFVIKGLFHRRNRIVHSGKVDFQQADAETCVALAATLSEIFKAMDNHRRLALEAKNSP